MPESPTATDIQSATPAPESMSADVTNAEPSTAKPQSEGVQQKSAADAVNAALNRLPSNPPKLEANLETAKSAEDSTKEPEELSPEELGQLSMKTQLRIRFLSNESKTLRSQLDASNKKSAEFDQFQSSMQQHRVSPEDAKATFELMGLMRSQPREALNRLHPIVTSLLQAAGLTLPQDLQEEVKAGKISQERAQELSSTRADAQRFQKQGQETQQQTEREAQQRHVDSLSGAADQWAAEKAGRDPDWGLKVPRVMELLKLHLYESDGLPKSTAETRKLLEEKLAQVESDMKRFSPKPTAINPPPKLTGGSPSATAMPTSAVDAINRALGAG